MDDDKVSVNVHQSSSNRTFCERLLADVSMISILVFVALFFRDFTLTMVIPVIPKALHLEDNAFLVSKCCVHKWEESHMLSCPHSLSPSLSQNKTKHSIFQQVYL